VKVDLSGYAATIDEAGSNAARAEAQGYDGWWAAETQIDAFLAAAVAVERTEQIEIGLAIAVAFARNPMTVAVQANDLQLLSGGRFSLGLGSQIKPHIEKRFSMPWSHPAPRMREFVLAVRAIWQAWETSEKLDFRGDFYSHTLMTPFFDPGPNPHGVPDIYLAAVGPLMTEVAGEVADGFFCHGFTTERYLREVTIPALERGRAKAGKTMEGFEIMGPSFVATGSDEAELETAKRGTREQVAFYGSTPAYRPVLELHGWGALQTKLNELSKKGEWKQMGELIDDEVLNTFAVVGPPESVGGELNRRYSDIISRLSFYAPYKSDPQRWERVLADIKGG
jgi:probable F420-dependent oxidoreductase